MAEPIPLDAARRRKKVRDETPPDDRDVGQCPVIALGQAGGKAWFLDVAGAERHLTAAQLGKRSELQMLFGGDLRWLEENFTQKRTRKETIGGETIITELDIGFNAADAAAYLMRQAFAAGIYGPHVTMRHPGIWRDSQGRPAVHCGDMIWMAGEWKRAGVRIDGTVWVSGAPLPRPDKPCGPDIGRALQHDLQRLWTFKRESAAIVCIGVTATGLLGAAPSWRVNMFLRAGPNSGKTMLMDVLRGCAPMHHYTNDTSAAGVTGAMNGKAMPIFIDEPSDRVDQEGAQKVMDLVLASSGGEGIKGHRGTNDGGFRTIEMVGGIIYASVSPPELQPQHLRRITMIDLVAPEAGADHKAEMEALAARMKADAPRLWGRVLAHWPEWLQAAAVYRNALAAVGCAGGEIDQMSAILAGWWIMTEDGVPDAREARIGVIALGDFVRVAEDVADDAGARRVVEALLSSQVQYDGSTRQEQVGTLMTRVFGDLDHDFNANDIRQAQDCLARFGIRVVRAREMQDKRGRPVPRLGDGDGVWLMPVGVKRLFHGGRFEGDRWRIEILRLPTARGPSKFNIRIGGLVGKPIWLGREDIDPAEPVSFSELLKHVDLKPAELIAMMDRHGERFPVAQRVGLLMGGAWLFDVGKVVAFIDRVREKPPPE